MKEAKKPSVGKLLRVLVAGGVALAGTAAPRAATAEEAPKKADASTTEKAEATGKADAESAKKKAAGTEKEKEKGKEKKAEEAGGVKGW
jgi:hypothetical protein